MMISTFKELMAHEEDILRLIHRTLNGGNLFVANPFLLLADVGFDLAPDLRKELIAREPSLANLSSTGYDKLKAHTSAQPIQVQVRGLFQRTQP
jgi:hypothetical protein